MAKFGAESFALLLVDGFNLIASLSESATMGKESLTSQTNPFGSSGEAHDPVGIERGTLTVGSGFYDETTDELHTVLGTISNVSRVVSAGIEGNVIGKHFMGFEGVYAHKYDLMDARDNLVRAQAAYLINGVVEEGIITQNHATFTADWDTKTGGAGVADAPVDYTLDNTSRSVNIASSSVANPSVITTTKPHGLVTGQKILISGHAGSTPTINGERTVTVTGVDTFTIPVNVTVGGTGGTLIYSSTTLGGAGYLHVTAYSGLTNVVVKIMHSPDDVTYAALVTFATKTAIGAERKTVTGTVDRYLSTNGDVTGAGSVTVFAGFARN